MREDEEKDYFNTPSVRRLDIAFSLAPGVSQQIIMKIDDWVKSTPLVWSI